MQSVLSVQAARAGKATEKREMEGKIVCKAGWSKCNTSLEMLWENPHLRSGPGLEQKASPSLTSCQLQWQSSWSKSSPLLCLPVLQRSLISYSYCTLIFHMKLIYIKIQNPRRKISLIPQAGPPQEIVFPYNTFQSLFFFFLVAVALKHGINEIFSLVLCLIYLKNKTKQPKTHSREVTVWNILQPPEQDKISQVCSGKNGLHLLRYQTPLNPGPCRTVNMVTSHSGTLLCEENPARSWAGLTLIFFWPTKTDQIAKTVNLWPWFFCPPTASWNVWFLSLLSASSFSLPRSHHGGRFSPDSEAQLWARRSRECWGAHQSPPQHR